jgi:2-oxoglutarate dehydrogenase E2 component (dihydrolipoamide succinyltransferase)
MEMNRQMTFELRIPESGESITEVQIAEWRKQEGDAVEKEEIVVEIETDKASMELPSPVSGTLIEIVKENGETVSVGEVIARIMEASEREEHPEDKTSSQKKEPRAKESTTSKKREKEARKEAEKEDDVSVAKIRPARAQKSANREEEKVPMTMLRRRIAERLVRAQQTSALLTTFNEIDMSAVMDMRSEYGPAFRQKHGVKLGLMSFFVKVVIEALKPVPALNAEIQDNHIVYKNYYDIGIAVSAQQGLVVPVLRAADQMSFAEIEVGIADFAERARIKKLAVNELQDGTFTISNGGVYGSLLSTPIVNPPQSGILGLHAIQDRPVAREGNVVIRPMMYIALTYDHRIVDGREAVTFLKNVKKLIEMPALMLIEV